MAGCAGPIVIDAMKQRYREELERYRQHNYNYHDSANIASHARGMALHGRCLARHGRGMASMSAECVLCRYYVNNIMSALKIINDLTTMLKAYNEERRTS